MKDAVSHYVPPPSPLTSTAPQAFSDNLTMPSEASGCCDRYAFLPHPRSAQRGRAADCRMNQNPHSAVDAFGLRRAWVVDKHDGDDVGEVAR